jgi:hypothetical protein
VVVSFRQTYGDERKQLYDIFAKDKRLIELLDLCDINLHSFHNCSQETIDYYKSKNKVKNSEYLEFNECTYTETIKALKVKLKEMGCTHFLFTQDDHFSFNNEDIVWEELIEYVKEHDKNFMLNLTTHGPWVATSLDLNYVKPSFKLFKTSSTSIHKQGIWSTMDDQPYMSTIDIIDLIYDDVYCEKGSIWDGEMHLKKRFDKESITKFLFERKLFKAYNLMGRTLSKKEQNIEELKKRNLYVSIIYTDIWNGKG